MKKVFVRYAALAAIALAVSAVLSNVSVKWQEPQAAACEPGVNC